MVPYMRVFVTIYLNDVILMKQKVMIATNLSNLVMK